MDRLKLIGVFSFIAVLSMWVGGCQEDARGRPSGDVQELTDARQDVETDSGPSVERDCSNDTDDDGDGLTDCSDTDCIDAQGCGRIIFGIEAATTGAMGGGTDAFEHADGICQDMAGNIPGLEPDIGWTAILGNTDTPAADRVGDDDGYVYNLLNTAVVGEDGNLFDASTPLQARILGIASRPFQEDTYMWTGTMSDGSTPDARYTSSTCVEWRESKTHLSGFTGHAASRSKWLSAEPGPRTQLCSSELGLYCISSRQQ